MSNLDLELPFYLFENNFDNDADKYEILTWGEIIQELSKHQYAGGKNGLGFQIVSYKTVDDEDVELNEKERVRRAAHNVTHYFALHLDFDNRCSVEQAQEFFKEYEHCGYTSFNNLKTEGVEKFRIVLPLEEPVTALKLRGRKDAILSWLNDLNPDTSTLDIARLFYMPFASVTNMQHARSWHNEGHLLNIVPFEENKEEEHWVSAEEYVTDLTDEKKKFILEALIQGNTYNVWQEEEVWWRIGAAMAAEGFSKSDFLAVTWADGKSQKYAAKKWDWLVKHGPKINAGYLVNIIREKVDPNFLVKKAPKVTESESYVRALQRLKNRNHQTTEK